MRHLQTRYLWHQEALRTGQFTAERCSTNDNPADLGTKALEADRIRKCLAALYIGDITAMGFKRTAAMRMVAALLVMDSDARADGAGGEITLGGELIPYAIEEADGGADFYHGLVAGLVTGILVTAGGAYMFSKLFAEHRRDVVKEEPTAPCGPVTRDVSVQGPVTYTRGRQQPRFVPLPEHSWGAWRAW